jgi:hypothetical protein
VKQESLESHARTWYSPDNDKFSENFMTAARISLFKQNSETPRGRLDGLWWKTMTPMSTAMPVRMLDEQRHDLHEIVTEFKQRADLQHATTGIYPDGEVQKFLAKFL